MDYKSGNVEEMGCVVCKDKPKKSSGAIYLGQPTWSSANRSAVSTFSDSAALRARSAASKATRCSSAWTASSLARRSARMAASRASSRP